MKTKKSARKMLIALFAPGFVRFGVIAGETLIENVNAAAGDQNFVRINRSGIEIYALDASPHSSKSRGEDILGTDGLFGGEELLIYFPGKQDRNSSAYASKTGRQLSRMDEAEFAENLDRRVVLSKSEERPPSLIDLSN